MNIQLENLKYQLKMVPKIAQEYPLEQKVLDFCISGKTRSEICKFLNMPWTTVFDFLTKLASEGKIDKYSKKKTIILNKVGRPKVFWKTI